MFWMPIVPVVQPLRSRVRMRSDYREESIGIERAVELMPMHHQHLRALSGLVQQRTYGRDAPDQFFDQTDFRFIMIARQENHIGAATPPLPDFIDQFLLLGAPVPRRPQVPSVDDVADQVERLRDMIPQEIEQRACLARACSEMHIRDPDRSVIHSLNHGPPLPLMPREPTRGSLPPASSDPIGLCARPTFPMSELYDEYAIRLESG